MNSQPLEAPKLTHPILRSLTEAATDEVEHIHDYQRVPKGERTDRLRFACSMYRCKCGHEEFV